MSIASELQDKIDAKAAIKASIEAKGVTVGDVKLNQYASKVDAIAQDPSIPVGTGQHLVTFYDFDGKVLKRQRVNTGENATAPAIPTHQYLTFAEWNNPFTNVQSDVDTGAIYNTTNGKTYLFITLTAVTGLAPTLYFSKISTSLMTIDWGDGTTSTSTTSGNQSINHVYATAGDYIITVNNSAGGTWAPTGTQKILYGYENALTLVYLGLYLTTPFGSFESSKQLRFISLSNYASFRFQGTGIEFFICNKNYSPPPYTFYGNQTLRKLILNSTLTTIGDQTFFLCYALSKKIIFPATLTTISGGTNFSGVYVRLYIFLSTTPPTLANINAFTGINPICKIYVPDASVEAYKAATNWSFYANYIYPLSSKPQSDE